MPADSSPSARQARLGATRSSASRSMSSANAVKTADNVRDGRLEGIAGGSGRTARTRLLASARGLLCASLILLPTSGSIATEATEATREPDATASASAAAVMTTTLDASQRSAIDLASYQGSWRQIGSDDAESARFTAIERAIGGLSWIVRKMAGGMLRSSTAPPRDMLFLWDGAQLYQSVDGKNGGFTRPVELGGEPLVATDRRGEPFSSAWASTRNGIALMWEQKQAHGRNVYWIADDGETLVVEHTINITGLSGIEPIVYESRFGRRDLPEVAAEGDPGGG